MAVLEWGEKWLSFGDTPEPAYRALMLAHAARGDMAKVTRIYQRCVEALREELGVEPSAETRALYDGLVKGAQMPTRAPRPSSPPARSPFFLPTLKVRRVCWNACAKTMRRCCRNITNFCARRSRNGTDDEVDTQGDAFFVTFARATDAVACAVEAQRALRAHAWPHGERVRVRMGLHTGEPLMATTGYIGMDVHRAARIGDAGHGGQVLLSQTTRDLVDTRIAEGVTLRDLGEHRLKDLKFPVADFSTRH